jgi:Tol biopolymer transport system component
VLKSPAALVSAIWIQRTENPNDRRALVKGSFSASQGRVSPDGDWLAFSIQRSQESSEVFVQAFDRPGDRIQVSVKGGHGPIWGDDGRELYYEASGTLMAVSTDQRGGALTMGAPQKLFSLHTQGMVANLPHNVEAADQDRGFWSTPLSATAATRSSK